MQQVSRTGVSGRHCFFRPLLSPPSVCISLIIAEKTFYQFINKMIYSNSRLRPCNTIERNRQNILHAVRNDWHPIDVGTIVSSCRTSPCPDELATRQIEFKIGPLVPTVQYTNSASNNNRCHRRLAICGHSYRGVCDARGFLGRARCVLLLFHIIDDNRSWRLYTRRRS